MSEDLRVIKTRANIQSGFISLLNDYAFQDISIKMLIEKCKINRSTFYRNYEDKFDLLNQIANNLLNQYKKTIRPEIITLHPNSSKDMASCLFPLVNFFNENRETLLTLYKNYIPVHLFDAMAEIMTSCFLDEIKSTYVLKEIKLADYYLNVITGNILTTMKWWHLICPEWSEQEIIDILITCITKGVYPSMNELI